MLFAGECQRWTHVFLSAASFQSGTMIDSPFKRCYGLLLPRSDIFWLDVQKDKEFLYSFPEVLHQAYWKWGRHNSHLCSSMASQSLPSLIQRRRGAMSSLCLFWRWIHDFHTGGGADFFFSFADSCFSSCEKKSEGKYRKSIGNMFISWYNRDFVFQ